ncbi:MAG: MFS transporter [Hyphomonadaceae bacterium]|nr:MFS transporter [Hyphomonadaceae bacterium]
MTTDAQSAAPATDAPAKIKIGNYRWVVCGLLFAALVINYVDRQMIGVLKPDYLQPQFGWSETDYANLVIYFQGAYAAAYLIWGRIIDRIGAKWGFAAAFTLWTLAHIAHAGARNMIQFALVRIALGVGEAGGFPGGIKAVTDWFPKKERALATGIFNAGTNIGAIVTPLVVPLIVAQGLLWDVGGVQIFGMGLGWEASFVIVGAATLLWLPAWWLLYAHPDKSKFVGAPELAFIRSDPPDQMAKVPWLKVAARKETWAYAIGKFLIDPVWWMFLFWLPDFLARTYNMNIKQFGLPLVAIYLISDIGSVGGGWLSSTLMHRGMSLNAARKTAMFICACMALPVFFAAQTSNVWVAVLIIGIATAAHQGFSANLYTLPGDVFPRSAVGTVIGIGGALGGVGGMLFSNYVGRELERIGGYQSIFLVAGTAYLLALAIIHVITPKYEPAKLD